ncbi:MAG: trimethylamine methyltransferase family protein, partial [Gammaproteobacteria bacterium]|nr:trimethylamine methyltransferase family protein [Gammaproteobacteria bacterium]
MTEAASTPAADADGGHRRSRRRPGTEARPAPAPDRSRSYRHLINPFEPLKVFSDDRVAAIHQAALTILETHGMRVLLPEARAAYRHAGASVDESTLNVRLDRGLVTESLAQAPREITLHARDPQRHMPVWGRHVVFAPTSGPPNIMDTARGKRAGSFEDFCNIQKLCQNHEVIHVLGGGVEPQDVPVQFRHLETTRSMLMLTDKIPTVYARGPGQNADNFELIRIAY